MEIAQGAYSDIKESNFLAIARKWRDLSLPIDAMWADGGSVVHRSVNDFSMNWSTATLSSMHDRHWQA
jgi:hypothetical protein